MSDSNRLLVMQDIDILDQLIEDYNQGKVSALIGAGLSMNVSREDFKGWSTLLIDAYKKVYEDEIQEYHDDYRSKNVRDARSSDEIKDEYVYEKIHKENLLKLADKYVDSYGYHEAIDCYIERRTPYAVEEDGNYYLKKREGDKKPIDGSAFNIHKQLLSCNKFNNLFTTNYDNLLEFAATHFGNEKKNGIAYRNLPVCNATHLSDNANAQKIIKIHGSLRQSDDENIEFDNDNHLRYIIAQRDYDQYKEKHEAFTYLMRLAMLLGKFCLIGFSGDDPNYNGWLNWMKDILDKNNDNIKVYLIDVDSNFQKHTSEEAYDSKQMYYKNHHVAVLHLYDEKVLDRINPNARTSKMDERGPLSISEVLMLFLKYIESNERDLSSSLQSISGNDYYAKGYNYYYGLGVNKDYTRAFKNLELASIEGEKDKANAILAECHLYGRGTEISVQKAAECCEGNPFVSTDVLFTIAVSYDLGSRGADKNLTEAVKWYTKAAEQGHISAQYILAMCYDNGDGVTEDKSEAVKWYTKAAEQGHTDAQNGSAWLLHTSGKDQEALPWIEKALEKEPNDAIFIDTLAEVYQGLGRLPEALEQFEKCLAIFKEEGKEESFKETEKKIRKLKELMR